MTPPTTSSHAAAPTAQERRARTDRLARMSHSEQIAALRRGEFTLAEWCAFAQRHPGRVARLNGEFAFIAVTCPEVCER